MNQLLRTLPALLLIGFPTLAQTPPEPSAPSEVPATEAAPEPINPPALDKVLALAPADALFVAYLAEPDWLLSQPIVAEALRPQPGTAELVSAIGKTFEGSVMVAASGVPILPTSWRLTFAGRTRLSRAELFETLVNDLPPLLNLAAGSSSADFFDDGELGNLTLPAPLGLPFFVATRDGLVFASTNRSVALQWQQAGTPPDRFVDSEPFTELNQGRRQRVGALVWLDTRALVPLAAIPLSQEMPGLYDALQLERVEYVGLVAPPHGRPGTLRLAVGLREHSAGLWHLLASTPAPCTLAHLFPSDTLALFHGSMEHAGRMWEDVCAFLTALDPVLTSEYEQERAEFAAEVGLDPQSDLAANFGPEWALGWRFPTAEPESSDTGVEQPMLRDPVAAVRLRDVAKFKTHLHTLQVAFGLPHTTREYRGVTIYQAQRALGVFYYALVDDVLVLAPDADTIPRILDERQQSKTLGDAQRFWAVQRQFGASTSKLFFIDLAGVARAKTQCYGPDFTAPGRDIVLERDLTLGIAVAVHGSTLYAEFAAASRGGTGSSEDTWNAVEALTTALAAQELENTRRATGLGSLYRVLIACHIYADAHDNAWPTTLETLVAEGNLTPSQLCSPYEFHTDGEAGACTPYYVYAPAPDPKQVENPATTIVMAESEIHDGGAVFGFYDGHMEWVDSPRAEELLAELRAR